MLKMFQEKQVGEGGVNRRIFPSAKEWCSNTMTTKLFQDIPDICAEEICVGSEETVSAGSDDDHAQTGSLSESGDEAPGKPGPRGRADSGALLDMLAEVASQKLLFSPLKRDDRRDAANKISSAQMKTLSTNQLISLFSTTEFDEMRKRYTYFCSFDEKCRENFFSFGNESRAKERFKEHLLGHVKSLKSNESRTISKPRRRGSITKKIKKMKSKEIKEENDDEEDIVSDDSMKPKLDWGETFILPDPDPDVKVEVEMVATEPGEIDVNSVAETSSAMDLNKLIAGLSEKVGVTGEHSYSTADPVLVYVLEGDSMVMKYLPPVAQQVDVRSESTDYTVVRSAELPVIANKGSSSPPPASVLLDPSALWELNNGENIERDEFRQARKPKGKAKFIGQSQIEKEQALEAMEAIRQKTGGGLETLQCSICQPPRTFTAPTTLISHYRSHAGIKPYECRICAAVFTRQHSLNYHMLIHMNQTRFTCQDCGRKFRHPSHFREHRRRHTGESPFECSDCLMRFKTRNTYKRHLRTRHGKVLTTFGGLIILSEDEFQMVKTAPRTSNTSTSVSQCSTLRRGRPRKSIGDNDIGPDVSIDAIDEDIQALHQLEIVTSNEGYETYKEDDEEMDMDEMPSDFLVEDGGHAAYEEIVKEAVRLERAEAENIVTFKTEESIAEETLVIETEDPLSGSGLYLATLEDGETVLVNTRDDDGDDSSGRVDLGFKLLEVGKVRRNSDQEPTVIVIKNEPCSVED